MFVPSLFSLLSAKFDCIVRNRCVVRLEMYELARAISSRFEPDHCSMPLEPTPTVHCILNEAMLQGHKLSGSAA